MGCSGRLWQSNKARPSAAGWRFAVSSIPFGWLTQTAVVSWDVCALVCVLFFCLCVKREWKRELSLIFTQAVLGLGISRHAEGEGKNSKTAMREKEKQASLLSSWLSRGFLYSSAGVHTPVWGRVQFLTGQQNGQKTNQKKTIVNMASSLQMCFSASCLPIHSYQVHYVV